MDVALAIIVGLLLGAGLTYAAMFTISTGLLGRRAQTPPKPMQGPNTDKSKATAPTTP